MAHAETAFEIKRFTDEFETFLVQTEAARTDSERDRDYVDHKQWTQAEVDKLEARGQAPVVINRTKTKVNLLTGIERQQRRDPKALPRTPQHEADADSVTDALRFVADNADFPQTSSDVFEDKVVWGYAGAIIEVEPDTNEIGVRFIPADRLYFDPHSRRLDFKDAKYMGVCVWLDEDDALTIFPDKADVIRAALVTTPDDQGAETFADRPLWVDRSRNRLRVCQHYFSHGGVWMTCFFTGGDFLIEPRPSPYVDERGEPENPIEAQTAYIDRDNMRYGEVRSYISPQDEVNKRRSKFLHLLSVRQTYGDEGAVDVQQMKTELAKPDGHVVLKGGPALRFDILENPVAAEGQFTLYQDAKGDIDAIGANAALSGTSESDLSGRALQTLQQGGLAEVGRLYEQHEHWERRVYRQIWHRVRQFWDEERWIRVTDREENLRWVGLNRRVTLGEALRRRAEAGDEAAQQTLQRALDDPRLNTVVAIENNLAELTVDVSLTTSPDTITLRQEQFEALAQLARSYGPEAVPFEAMLKLSDIPHKDEVMALLQPDEQQVDPEQAQAQQQLAAELAELEYRDRQAEVAKKEAEVEAMAVEQRKDAADAEAQEIENEFFRRNGISMDDARKSVSASTGS